MNNSDPDGFLTKEDRERIDKFKKEVKESKPDRYNQDKDKEKKNETNN